MVGEKTNLTIGIAFEMKWTVAIFLRRFVYCRSLWHWQQL